MSISIVENMYHQSDFESYYYFECNLSSIVPEPCPTFTLARISRIFPEVEYLGRVGHLNDVVQVRVKKDGDIDLAILQEGLEMVNGVQSVELQVPEMRIKKAL
ncbi:14206_t:CDS:1 [Funneliformis geosporum]|uniref:8786_t:CDS:1 n=1 Tax=Funneliformis geosporum TaxID=1117311 RepID=A0A9W4SM50_9GLOM|nr:14206_t:CDS:1 [Funneliformis geosporum]CAI2174116.1 8786_t:CDS:1 [Funneliformis geosporum]